MVMERRLARVPVVGLLLGLILCASLSADPVRIGKDVTRLAGDPWKGRRAGSPGADAAADWIALQFQEAGLEPAAGSGGYQQPFEFIDGVNLGPKSRFSFEGSGEPQVGRDFRPLAFSSAGQARAEAVFAGYGIVAPALEHDDFAGLEVKGKVVIMLRYGPEGIEPTSKWAPFTDLRLKTSNAREKGAVAVVFVTGPRTKVEGDELIPLRQDATLRDAGLPVVSITRELAGKLLDSKGPSLDEMQKALDEGAKSSSRALGREVEVVADLSPKKARTRNLIGLLRAPGSNEYVVVGAHYDHLGLGASGSLDPSPDGKIHHGADDNASGTAGLLDLARRLSTRKAELKRSILFVSFGAEELGTLGSSHFLKQPPVPLDQILAMANMDMIGRLRDGKLQVHGVGTSPVWKPLAEAANQDLKLELQYVDSGFGPSDHAPFYQAGKPVFFVFTGVHPDYHRPSDTADKIEEKGLDQVVSLVERVVMGLATGTDPVVFVKTADRAPGSGRGFRVSVGGMPDYSYSGEGVRFTGLMPGSPAEKAGLQAGDVIVKFGGRVIKDLQEYTAALGEHQPGDVVEVLVKRGETEQAFTLTLAARPSANR